eukprot:TRINITY_DN37396_c0_g1_i2.p1 TRINITY_DN37396_c0_g1~~TRINITY_DN37396_c0_g1_i2.p1  ORF type:complete len:259 (+),score=38.42 TRINITY_DN37396_c0_g1_i2:129-905(+)
MLRSLVGSEMCIRDRVYLLWVGFGFLSCFHMMGLLCCPPPARGNRRWIVGHIGIHFLALFVFALGGGLCRSWGADDCPGGETMSQSCLMHHQDSRYQFFYITHYMGVAWVAAQWIADGLSLWGWSRAGLAQEQLGPFGSLSGPGFGRMMWQYAAVGSCVALVTTLLWSIKWSTDPPGGGDITGTELVGGILFPVMIVWLGSWCLAIRCLGCRARKAAHLQCKTEENAAAGDPAADFLAIQVATQTNPPEKLDSSKLEH